MSFKISVIIPTRNRYNYIPDLVSDLKNQTVKNLEIIVVDQSTNKQVLADVHQINDDGIGPCRSRNIGARNASGDILVFLDDDARVSSNFIKELTKPIVEGKFVAVAGANCDPQGNYLFDKNEFLERNDYNFIKTLTRNPNSPNSRITMSFPGCCSAVLREVFFEIGGFDEDFDPTGAAEDREMAINLFKHGYGIWYNANAKFLHFGAETGGSRDVGSRSVMLDINTYKICKKHFSEELTRSLGKTIISKYRREFIKALKNGKLIRTKYNLYKNVKNEINEILSNNK